MKLKVLRSDENGKSSRHETFEIEVKPGMTVLGALFLIRDTIEDSLGFRYSCRGAVCGTCAMLINKVPRLACRTQLSTLVEDSIPIKLNPYPAIELKKPLETAKEVLVEPLPHLPVIRDLIVDMDKFFDYYRSVEPFFKPKDESPEKERLMEPSYVHELEKYTNCILCAACLGACPVNSRNEEYLGPAALAKLFRFYLDPREGPNPARLKLADFPSGWWACEFHTNCKRVCPKGVPPSLAIGQARSKLK
jgi:succinate dehydrogenase / fumarate reductase iron-sulfur subunit